MQAEKTVLESKNVSNDRCIRTERFGGTQIGDHPQPIVVTARCFLKFRYMNIHRYKQDIH